MKTIAIYCADLRMGGATFEKPLYWEAYQDLLLKLQGRGVEAFFVTDETTSYLGEGIFTQGYTLFKPGQPSDLIAVPFIQADLVFDRGDFYSTDVTVINPPEVFRLGKDKTAMYETFGRYQAASAVCRTRDELVRALDELPTELVVVKEPEGCGGFGVHIGTRSEVLAKSANATFPLLAQAFMDTSVGIPGIVEGVHDMRIVMLEGEILSGDVRTPGKAGEYRANVALGGSARYVPLPKIPAAVARLARTIDAHFGADKRYYAIDFANTPQGWKLIELNAQPGLIPSSNGPENAYVMNKLVNYLVRSVRDIVSDRSAETAVVLTV